MKINNYLVLYIVSFVLLAGFSYCKKEKGDVPAMGYNYFPINAGSYIVYEVDSFYHDDFNKKVDTCKFQLKEKIESIYPDNQNRPTARIERYIKKYNPTVTYSNMAWKLKNVWIQNITSKTAEKTEENIRYVKLVFPVSENTNWNGNAQNTLEKWNYQYSFINLPRTIGGLFFDSVLQVTQLDDKFTNLVEHKYYIEKYATGVGLVFKQVIDIKSQPGSSPPSNFFQIPIMQRVTSGFQYKMTVKSYGKE